jgi:hypothetical protein
MLREKKEDFVPFTFTLKCTPLKRKMASIEEKEVFGKVFLLNPKRRC